MKIFCVREYFSGIFVPDGERRHIKSGFRILCVRVIIIIFALPRFFELTLYFKL